MMRSPGRAAKVGGLLFIVAGCASQPAKREEAIAPKAQTTTNPLLAEWTGPYGGVPPFGEYKVQDLQPALEAAMAENLREPDAIAKPPEAPSFENTMAALDRTGKTLTRVGTVYAS